MSKSSKRPLPARGRERRTLLAALGSAVGMPAAARVEATALPHPASLPSEAAAAARRGDPLVLLVSLPDCPYCEQVRRFYLLSLREERGGGVVQIDVASSMPLIDFDRATRTDEAFARSRDATYTPTVLFLDVTGAEIAERLVGAGNPDYYGAYLDQRLATARRAVARRR